MTRKHARNLFILLAACLWLSAFPTTGAAQDWATYGLPANAVPFDLPTVQGTGAGPSWFTAADFFPAASTGTIDGGTNVGVLDLKGRIIAATGDQILLQRNYGSSKFDVVATVPGIMDPAFIHVSPSGTKIALGAGYGAPLVIIDPSVLSIQNPPLLWTGSTPINGVTLFPEVNFYDADWADDQYIVVNGGQYPFGDPPQYASGAGVVDTDNPDPLNHEGVRIIDSIPGASGDVEVDQYGNLYTGIGYGSSSTTGQIKVWDASEWDPANPVPMDYTANTKVLFAGNGLLSAAQMGTDRDGSLHLGGGNYFGSPPDYGYAALINVNVTNRVLLGGAAADPLNTSEFQEFQPDPCRNDSATDVMYSDWGVGLAVYWNPLTLPPSCASGDEWHPGVIPKVSIYHPAGAPDDDADGVPNVSDNAYLTPNVGAGQQGADADGDGWANKADADFDNNGAVGIPDAGYFRTSYGGNDPVADLDSNGTVGVPDAGIFRELYGREAPYY